MTGYLGVDLPKFLALLRARRVLVAGIVGSAVVLVLLASLAQSSRYRASAALLFGSTSAADVVGGDSGATAEVPEREVATNLALASLDSVAARVKRRLRSSTAVAALKDAVDITPQGDSDIVNVTAEWRTPADAAAVANAFAAEIVALRRNAARGDIQQAIDALEATLAEQPAATPAPGATSPTETEETRALRDRISELRLRKAVENGGVRVVEQATPPESRSSPRPLRNAVIAAFVALVLALFVVALLARFDERIHDEDELAALMQVPVLARVPEAARSRRLTHTGGPHTDPAFLEAFEFLRLNLQLMGPAGGNVAYAVTSPTAGDGKTMVVGWLARSLALSGAEVVAIDLDRRKPELSSYLNAYGEPGNGVYQPQPRDDGEAPAGNEWPAPGRRLYTAEDIRAGLTRLARFRGNARAAARSLRNGGRDVSESTLRRWKHQHAALYAEIASRTGEPEDTVAAKPRGRTAPAVELVPTALGPRVRMVSGTDHPATPIGLIGRDGLLQLFAELRNDADYVLVDTVPVSTVADASAVAAAADGVILVIDFERIRRRDLLAAKQQLDHARADLLGIVLNRAPVDSHGYAPEGRDDPFADEPPDRSASPLPRH